MLIKTRPKTNRVTSSLRRLPSPPIFGRGVGVEVFAAADIFVGLVVAVEVAVLVTVGVDVGVDVGVYVGVDVGVDVEVRVALG